MVSEFSEVFFFQSQVSGLNSSIVVVVFATGLVHVCVMFLGGKCIDE